MSEETGKVRAEEPRPRERGNCDEDGEGIIVHAYGRDSILIEIPDVDTTEMTALDAHLRQQQVSEILEIIPAEDTLLLRLDRPQGRTDHIRIVDRVTEHLQALRAGHRRVASTPANASDISDVEIPVVYDGEDLQEVARHCSMSVDGVIEMHTASIFTVAFCGFAPGFAYLIGLPERLHLPRRTTPRTKVPAGSVAIAEHYSAVYPRSSPGGWHLLGRTDSLLFDPLLDEPALLQPGMRVRFVTIVDRIEIQGRSDDAQPSPTSDPRRDLDPIARVIAPGASCLVEDLGRPGWGRIAVTESGAWDQRSHRLAQRLVGNREESAGLECLGGGLRLQALQPLTLAVTGAPGSITIWAQGRSRPASALVPLHLLPGEELRLGHPTQGLRRYVAIRGGLDLPRTMGSMSTDTLSGLGPPPLTPGAALRCSAVTGPIPASDLGLQNPLRTEVGIVPGPAWEGLAEASRRHLRDGAFTVSPASDRLGVRLQGPPLRWETREHPRRGAPSRASRPLVRGAIQLPPDGQPVVLGPDHPATGGYPVIGVLADPDAPAQWAPGVMVSLHEVVPFLLAPRAASSTGRAADS